MFSLECYSWYEKRWYILLEVSLYNSRFLLCSIYNPEDNKSQKIFLSKLNDTFQQFADMQIILGGNFNLALAPIVKTGGTLRNVEKLKGNLNTQKDEQLRHLFNYNTRYFNQLKPVNHIFLFYSNIDIQNERINRWLEEGLHQKFEKMAMDEPLSTKPYLWSVNIW